MNDSSTLTQTNLEVTIPGMWKCVIHNDDFTPMDFVTHVLEAIFATGEQRAEAIMLAAHENGRAAIGMFLKEVAVTKAQQAVTFASNNSHPLLITAEPA